MVRNYWNWRMVEIKIKDFNKFLDITPDTIKMLNDDEYE